MGKVDCGARIEGIAVKALLLDPGTGFAVRVKGGKRATLSAVERIDVAIKEQYVFSGGGMFPDLAAPHEIDLQAVQAGEATHVIIQRQAR